MTTPSFADHTAPGSIPIGRDLLGEAVRDAWIRWASSQPNPKPTWLVPYGDLSEPDKEADRQIGEHICLMTMLAIDASNGSPIHDHQSSIDRPGFANLSAIRDRLLLALASCRNDGERIRLDKILHGDGFATEREQP